MMSHHRAQQAFDSRPGGGGPETVVAVEDLAIPGAKAVAFDGAEVVPVVVDAKASSPSCRPDSLRDALRSFPRHR